MCPAALCNGREVGNAFRLGCCQPRCGTAPPPSRAAVPQRLHPWGAWPSQPPSRRATTGREPRYATPPEHSDRSRRGLGKPRLRLETSTSHHRHHLGLQAQHPGRYLGRRHPPPATALVRYLAPGRRRLAHHPEKSGCSTVQGPGLAPGTGPLGLAVQHHWAIVKGLLVVPKIASPKIHLLNFHESQRKVVHNMHQYLSWEDDPAAQAAAGPIIAE